MILFLPTDWSLSTYMMYVPCLRYTHGRDRTDDGRTGRTGRTRRDGPDGTDGMDGRDGRDGAIDGQYCFFPVDEIR
jgi:hypothetical protein